MTKLQKYNLEFKYFALFLTFIIFSGCGSSNFYVKKVVATKTNINTSIAETADIENYIKPYRDKVDKEMNAILSVASQNIDKSGVWQTPMGNLLSDATMKEANPLFFKRNNKSVDICLLNNGGIRANINKGNITTRTAFEVMPFENNLIIVELPGDVVQELVNFIIADKKPHPLSGMTFEIGKDGNPKKILIQGQSLDLEKKYYVATSDYLSGGGDKMDFFKKGTSFFDMDYKLRNVLIDFFKKYPAELVVPTDVRISEEK